jgi:hypothetical protein
MVHHSETEGSMISHEIDGIGGCGRSDPIGCSWTLSLNRGSLFVKGHGIVANGETIHCWFPPVRIGVRFFCYTPLQQPDTRSEDMVVSTTMWKKATYCS